MLEYIVLGLCACIGYYYKDTIIRKSKKLNQLITNYKREEPNKWYIYYVTKSLKLILKCTYIDLINYLMTVRFKKYICIPFMYGGNLVMTVIRVNSGPKKDIEYGYIDEIREDELISCLAGVNRDFSGYPESLLEFGNTIRYKFFGEDEVILYIN
jgi:hypothetical protein